MPEGDTIYRSADRLKRVLPHARIVEATDNGRFVRSALVVDATFQTVQARGKHLLMHLQDGRVIHSHMGMTGSWHSYRKGDPWRKPTTSAALAMVVEANTELALSGFGSSVVVCFSPKTLELLSATAFRRHPYLQRLGPDLMREKPDGAEVLKRFRLHDLVPIGEAVMNQTIVSGIGNVYKSETLFLTGINPFMKVGELTDDRILTMVDKAQTLMHQNVGGHPRRTRRRPDGARVWVYGRGQKPCFTCGATIRMRRQGDLGRSTYWCPTCQSDV